MHAAPSPRGLRFFFLGAPVRRAVVLIALLAPGSAAVACGSSSGEHAGGADASGDVSMGADARADVAETSTGDATATDGALDAAIGPDGSTSDVDAGPPLADAFSGDCGAGPFGEPLDLSCTGLYSDFATKTVAAENEAFTPGLALWSDGAEKQRWIDLPPGTTIDTSNMDEWTFPVGTKFFKEFALPLGDASTVTRIETRMLWKTGPGSWYRTTYRWSDDGTTSATELTGGQLDAGGTGYEVPTQSDCNTCHNGRLDGVLGFEAVALGQPAAAGLTLAQLETRKLLSAPPTTAPRVPGDATQATAIGWLHMNCGTSCHNAGNGLAAATGFHMRLDVDTLTTLQTTDVYTTGWNLPTTGFQIPGVTASYRLHACSTSTSCVYYRDDSRDGVNGVATGTQMPPLDTHKVDPTGVAEVAAWINEGCPDAGEQ